MGRVRETRWLLLALCSGCSGDPDAADDEDDYGDSTDEGEHLGPPSTGHLPILEVQSELLYTELEVDPLARIWVADRGRVGGVDDELALVWQQPLPGLLGDFLADDGGWATFVEGNEDVGFVQFGWETPVADPIQPHAMGTLARFRDGLIAVDRFGGIRHLGPDGQLRWSTDFALPAVYGAATTTADGVDRLGLGGRHWAGSFSISDAVPPTIEAEFLVAFEWAGYESANVNALAFSPNGLLTVTGSLLGKGPWTAQLDANGEFTWEWAYWEDVPVEGENTGVAIATDGSIYTVGTEDPSDGATEGCDSFGCERLVVRKHAPDGDLVWQYEHRLAHSKGSDIAIDANGNLLVAGTIERGERVGVLFRFEADE